MFEGYYGKEPFDLRLTALRLMRNLNKILLITLAGTLLFGGGYYVKNVLLHTEKEYAATSTYMVEYVNPPKQSGDYYINHMSWNTLVQSEEFLTAVEEQYKLLAASLEDGNDTISAEAAENFWENADLPSHVSATLPSDWNIPTTTVITEETELTTLLAAAVEAAMVNDMATITEAIAEVRVIDPGVSKEVVPDVRPVRAVILSALLSFFFAIVLFLLKELGEDSIWLPGSLRVRYGLKVLGTAGSPDYKENFKYLFADKRNIAVCPLDERIDSTQAVKVLKTLADQGCAPDARTAPGNGMESKEWTALPAPLLCPEVCQKLRETEGVLLLVPAGSHVGKRLEYVLDYLRQQGCCVTAVVLWDADETLLKLYYGLDFSQPRR